LLQKAPDCSALFVQAFMANNVIPVVLQPLRPRSRTPCLLTFPKTQVVAEGKVILRQHDSRKTAGYTWEVLDRRY